MTLKAFLTGSHAYGLPSAKSDVDLVVFLSVKDLEKLRKLAEVNHQIDGQYESERIASLRFGNLNLVCVTTEDLYGIWRTGTRKLKAQAPVSRDFAIQFLNKMRNEAGVKE